MDLIIFPSDYFNSNIVDYDMLLEFNAARNIDGLDTVIFGYEKWYEKEILVLNKKYNNLKNAIYRGWMMKPDKYEKFYNELLKNNIKLITTPKEYELMHLFPNVYKFFKDDTAKMEIFPFFQKIDIDKIKLNFDKFMIKDFVKSVKGSNFPLFFDKNITQEEFDKWMGVFYNFRGELLTGGICVKEFLNLKKYDGLTNEYRVFYGNNEVISISKNSNQKSKTSNVPEDIIRKYKNLESKYYTVDFAELEDGSWKVIEAGDGSVSGLSNLQDIKEYYLNLYKIFK